MIVEFTLPELQAYHFEAAQASLRLIETFEALPYGHADYDRVWEELRAVCELRNNAFEALMHLYGEAGIRLTA